jgi:TrfA protein
MTPEQQLAKAEAAARSKALRPALGMPEQLPLWADAVRGVPNGVLRSALFGAIAKGRRPFLQREVIASLDGITILFTGPRLDQADMDVWDQCLHLARISGLGVRIEFSAGGFLKSVGRSRSGQNIEWLKNALARLAASVVEITVRCRGSYFGAMIHDGARDKLGHYAIQINPAIVALYGADGWTGVDWERRQALRGQPLAQWLHGFYSSHDTAYPMKVGTLRKLCGSNNDQLDGFRRDLRDSLGLLGEVTGWAWSVDDGDLVRVSRSEEAVKCSSEVS